jgi:hypothetical protein
MINMTNNRVPYDLLTDEEKAALEAHEKAGGAFSYIGGGGRRYLSKTWRINSIVRAVPLPEKTQYVIAWEKLPDWAEWVARDRDGTICAYDEEPEYYVNDWMFDGSHCTRIDDFPGIVQIGTVDWKDSKQRRPR